MRKQDKSHHVDQRLKFNIWRDQWSVSRLFDVALIKAVN